ncbi:MAG: hypothetical protein ACKO6E_09045, partial [Planctomycetota bacterium]
MLVFEEGADDPRLIPASAEVCPGVHHRGRLITGRARSASIQRATFAALPKNLRLLLRGDQPPLGQPSRLCSQSGDAAQRHHFRPPRAAVFNRR